MSIDETVAFLVFSVVAAVTPGPSNVLVAGAGASAGLVRGLPCLLGVVVGMGLMMFVVPLGLGALVLGHPAVLAVLKVGGSMLLLHLAWRIATARELPQDGGARPVGFLAAAAFQWVNPKSWLVSVSAAGTWLGGDGGGAVAQAAWLGGLFALAALPSCLVWLAFGAAVRGALADPRRRRAFSVVMGVALAASVLMVIA